MKKRVIHILCAFMLPIITWAHEIRPGYLEIKENTDHSLVITWKQPTIGVYSISLHPAISLGWMSDSLAAITYSDSYLIKRWHIPAGKSSLDGQTISIGG